jgi:predicted MFS family arabinose efflux permease
MLVVGVVPLLVALSLGRASGNGGGGGAGLALSAGQHWASPLVLGLIALSAAGIAAFIFVERRAREPILDLTLFRTPVFARGNVAIFVVGAAFFSGIVFLPLFMVNVVGLSATRSGATLTPLTLALVVGNVVSGQLVTRFGRYRPFMLGALVVLGGAFALLALTLSPASTQLDVTLKMVLVGIGLGPSIPLYTLAIQNGVSTDRIGVATSMATFFRQMGATIGVALQGTVMASTMASTLAHEASAGHGHPSAAAVKAAFSTAVSNVFRVSVLIVVLGFIVTSRLPELPLRRNNR